MVHSASVGPIRMPLWSALEHMLSVMTPVKVRLSWALLPTGAPAATTRKLAIRMLLFTGRHDMRGRGAGVHDPDAALRARLRQAEGLGGCARHGDRHVRARVRRIAHQVIPYRSELRFHAGPV